MARARALHQKFFTSEHNMNLTFRQRLLFLGMISIANDYGKLRGHPAYISSAIFPYDHIPNPEIESDLKVLQNEALVLNYCIENAKWVLIVNWLKYQAPNHPGKDEIPNPSQEILETFKKASRKPLETLSPVVVVVVEGVVSNVDREKWFEDLWKRYPSNDGKKQAKAAFMATVKTEEGFKRIHQAMENYLASDRVKEGYIKNGSTWFRNWQDWIELKEKPKGGSTWTHKMQKEKIEAPSTK